MQGVCCLMERRGRIAGSIQGDQRRPEVVVRHLVLGVDPRSLTERALRLPVAAHQVQHAAMVPPPFAMKWRRDGGASQRALCLDVLPFPNQADP